MKQGWEISIGVIVQNVQWKIKRSIAFTQKVAAVNLMTKQIFNV